MAFFRPNPSANNRILHADQNKQKHPVSQPIVFGSSDPTEDILSFVNSLLQPIVQNKSHKSMTLPTLSTSLPNEAFPATLNICSFYTNIPQEKGIEAVSKYYQEQ